MWLTNLCKGCIIVFIDNGLHVYFNLKKFLPYRGLVKRGGREKTMTAYKCAKYGSGCLATGLLEKMYALEGTISPLCQIHAQMATRDGKKVISFAAALRAVAREEDAWFAEKKAAIERSRSADALPPRGQSRKDANRQWGNGWREGGGRVSPNTAVRA